MKGNNKQMSEAGSARRNAHRRHNLGAGKPARHVTFRGSLATSELFITRVSFAIALGRVSSFRENRQRSPRRLLEIHRKREMHARPCTSSSLLSSWRRPDIPPATINSPSLRLHLFVFLGSGTALLKRKLVYRITCHSWSLRCWNER